MAISGWKLSLARQYLQQADAAELQELMNTLMPLLVQSLSPQERAAMIKVLLNEHLGLLLQGIDESTRAELLNQALPSLVQLFPLDQVNLLDAFAPSPPKP